MQLRSSIRSYFQPRRHTVLLALLIALVFVRPLVGDGGVAPILFSAVLLALLLLSLYNIQVDELIGDRDALLAQRRRRNLVGWTLAILAISERVMTILAPSARVYLVGSVSWFVLFAFVTWSTVRSVLKQREVTAETISMAISAYLLLGVTWGLLYSVIYQLDPAAFNLGASFAAVSDFWQNQQRVFTTFVYFSLTTLSTIGYGDITALSTEGRYAAVAEGIAGQMYLAILVARLVAVQMTRSTTEQTQKQR